MKNKADRAELITESPDTFAGARQFIINLETSRRASKQVPVRADSSGYKSVNAAKKSEYQKKKWSPPPEQTEQKSTTKQRYHVCGKGRNQHGKFVHKSGKTLTK